MAAFLSLGVLIGLSLNGSQGLIKKTNASSSAKKLTELIEYIEAKYVDDVDTEAIVEDAIKEVMGNLDPHSSYINADQLASVNEQMEGNFEGIGVEFMTIDDTIVITQIMHSGPAKTAGLIEGDKILALGDSIIAGNNWTNDKIISVLKGPRNSIAELLILRGDEEMNFDVKRDWITVNSIGSAYMLDEKTGYIKINRFSSRTYREFMSYLEHMVDNQNMINLMIDVRGNPGGYLKETVNILSQLFKEKSKMLVYTEGKNARRHEYKSTGKNFFEIEEIAVLIDKGSASGSEILAGAIQDYDRGTVVGRASFGKGLVQEQYPLSDGSALRLTVARYYTPSGRFIQKPYEDKNAYHNDLNNRFDSGALFNKDSVEVIDSLIFTTEAGRVVYGGQGIFPDVFVADNEILYTSWYNKFSFHFPEFIYKEFFKDASFNEMEIWDFIREYEFPVSTIEHFRDFLHSKGEAFDERKLFEHKSFLLERMKVRLAKQLYGDEGMYMQLNHDDPVVLKALETIYKKTPLSLNE